MLCDILSQFAGFGAWPQQSFLHLCIQMHCLLSLWLKKQDGIFIKNVILFLISHKMSKL